MTAPLLGPRDYLIAPSIVHVMRFGGRNDDGYEFWRLACGSRFKVDDDYGAGDWLHPGPIDLDVVREQNLATCKRCFPEGVPTCCQ